MRGWIHAIAICLLILGSCTTHSDTIKLIERAERSMIDHPDSALSIINSIDPENIHGHKDMAHYRLVLAETLYYNNLSIDMERHTQPLFDYYFELVESPYRARAMFQHANVLYYLGQLPEAMYAIMEAEKSLVNNADDDRLSGIIYLTKGEIYGLACLYDNALQAYHKSLKHFTNAKLTYHQAYTEYRIGEALFYQQRYDDAKSHLHCALEAALSNNYHSIANIIVSKLCLLYIYIDDIEECSKLLSMYDKYQLDIDSHLHYYFTKAIIESANGNKEDALRYMELADSYDDQYDYEIDYYKYIVHRNINNTEEAIYWLEQNRVKQQALMLSILELPILNMQVESLQHDVELANAYKRNVYLSYLIIGIITAILIAIICLYAIKKKKQYQLKVAQYIEAINELQTLRERDKNSPMSEQVYNIYKMRFAELNELCNIYYDHYDSNRQKSLVLRQLQNTIESLKSDNARIEEMTNIVNLYRDNIMVKLEEECPKLSERQKRIALYSFAGLSLRAIALFLNSNPVQISKDKYKIKSIINKCNPPSCKLFIDSL